MQRQRMKITAAGSRRRPNLKLGSLKNDHGNCKYENFTSSFGRLRQEIAPKSVPHVHNDSFSLFSQWNHGVAVVISQLTP